MTLLEDIYL